MRGQLSWFTVSALCRLLIIVLLVAGGGALSPGRVQFAQPAYNTTEDFGVAYVTGTNSNDSSNAPSCHDPRA